MLELDKLTPDEFWITRWESLRESINSTIQYAEKECPNGPFTPLLTALKKFGAHQFYYFYLGFGGSQDSKPKDLLKKRFKQYQEQKLVADYACPPSYVLRVIIDQIAYDYEVIQRAMYQRTKNAVVKQSETLKLADAWSEKLLKRVIYVEHKMMTFFKATPTIITYFNRSPQIRMIPYANVALIGIPLTTTLGSRHDLLIIPHELGHYIFGHGQIEHIIDPANPDAEQIWAPPVPMRQKVKDIVQGKMPFFENWIEEIFADIFGLAVSGEPAMLPWALSMVADNNPDLFIRDENVHPIDAIRPYIYLYSLVYIVELLEESNENLSYQAIGNSIEQKLTGKLENIENIPLLSSFLESIKSMNRIAGGYESFKAYNILGDLTTVPLKDILPTLFHIITRIIDEIIFTAFDFNEFWKGEHIKPLTLKTEAEWWLKYSLTQALRDRHYKENVHKWYEKFEENFNPSANNKTKSKSTKGYTLEEMVQSNRAFMQLRDTLFSEALKPDIWKIVLAADGWTVRGPEGRPTGDWEQSSFHV